MIKQIKLIVCFGIVICAVLTFGCAFNLMDVKYQSVRIESIGDEVKPFMLSADTPIHGAPCGYSRSLRKGTKWEAIGRVGGRHCLSITKSNTDHRVLEYF